MLNEKSESINQDELLDKEWINYNPYTMIQLKIILI